MFVIDRFEKAVLDYPNNTALLLEDGREITYEELNNVANIIGQMIYKKVTIVNSSVLTPLVCVMFNRDIAFFAAILGILKAECAYVPIDPSFASDRQSYIFSHSKCELLLTDQESYDQANQLNVILPASCIIIDSKTGSIKEFINTGNQEEKQIDIIRKNNLESLAYILYTSGSTGKPKGVMVKQTSVSNFIDWVTSELKTNSKKIVLALTTFCFDVSISEIFQALTMGATLVVALSTTQKNPYRLIELINETGITVMHATPSTFEMMFVTGWDGNSSIDFLVAGEAFRPSLFKLVYNCSSIRNAYGPSETTTYSSSFTLTKNFVDNSGDLHVPIGPPILNTVFYIVDPDSSSSWRQVDYEEGELWIGGDGLAQGYLYAPELTNEKFIKNPFDSGLVYRTGDIVKRLPDSSQAYVYIRRMDDLVKVNGFRIELQEIEVVYNQHPLLEQTVALVRSEKLVIYMKARSSRKLNSTDLEDIKKFVSKSLNYYMVPSFTMQVEEFPKTSSDKIDKKCLPDPPGLSDTIIALEDDNIIGRPSSISSILCSIIASTRGTHLPKTSSFASIGIDSFGALLFLRQVSSKFDNIRIDAKHLYSPGVTVQSFARALYNQLQVEKPELLKSLNLVEELEDESKETQLPLDLCNDSLEVMLASNLRLIEGVRGALAFLVLWDHHFVKWSQAAYGTPPLTLSSQADTWSFVMLSGFITSLTFRRTATFDKSSDTVTFKYQNFSWQSFIFSRVMGLYPVLWICFVLFSPIWKESYGSEASSFQTGYYKPWKRDEKMRVPCYCMYALGMQTWRGEDCFFYGPRYMYYASVIINCFLMYALIRVVFSRFQNYLISWRHPSLDSSLSKLFFQRTLGYEQSRTWMQYIGNIVAVLSLNKADRLLATVYSVCCFTFGTGVVLIDITYKYLDGVAVKDHPVMGGSWEYPVHYLVFYIFGAVSASVVATWHSVLYQTTLNSSSAESYYGEGRYLDFKFNNTIFSSIYSRVFIFFCPRKASESRQHSVVFYLWRHTPDMLAVAYALLMTTVGDVHLSEAAVKGYTCMIFIPWLFLAYLITSTLQVGAARLSISRYILETPVLNLLGYCSYPLYILQLVIYWNTTCYESMYFDLENKKNLGPYKKLGWKFVLVIIMITASVAIQYFIQDNLVPYLVVKFSSLKRKLCQNLPFLTEDNRCKYPQSSTRKM